MVSVLPCLHADFLETGIKPHLIISTKYANVVEGLDYLEPVIYPGSWEDVAGAMQSAKRRYKEVLCPQMHTKDYVPRRMFPSFQLDQWDRCGRLHQWGLLPLVMPRHGETIQGKYILLGDHSESSPFLQIEDLHASLVKEFPSHRIVRLSSVRLPLLADLLALYDAADLIITIDTLHSHLTLATATPVIVLATEKPSRWHGTAYHPRMAAHIRYGDYEIKKDQLLHVAKQCVNKSPMPVVTPIPTGKEYGYNMSLLRVGDNVWKTYRYHPGKSWRTELMLVIDGKEIPIVVPSCYAQHSIEDGRLFMFQNVPHISMTVARSRIAGQRADPCIQAYGRLEPDGTILNWIEPKIGKNDWSGNEKNWSFFEYQGKLHVSYCFSPSHTVYQLNSLGKKEREYVTPVPKCSFGEPRGGTQMIPYHEHWLKFFHTNQVNPKSAAMQNYHAGAMVIESSPPFRVRQVSKFPILTGNEMFNEAPFWKSKCMLPYGAMKSGDAYEVALGMNDSQCAIATVWKENLNL